MTIDFGAFSRTSASSDEMIGRLVQLQADLRQPLHAGTRGDDDGFLCVVLLVLAVGVFTVTPFFPASFAVPLMYVILFFLKRNSTPFEFCSADRA